MKAFQIALRRNGVHASVMRTSLCLVLSVSLSAIAQMPVASVGDYPNKPIRFVVPFSPGSGTDVSARFFSKKIHEITGQPVVIDNRSGANGFLGVKAVTAAIPDGYTILFGSNSTLATNVALFKQLPYDPVKDLVPVSTIMRSPIVLIVPAASPYKNLTEFVDAARAKPGQFNFASGSAAYQLMGELFAEKAGLKLVNVPYKGAPEVVNATISAQVDLGLSDVTAAIELIRGGKVRALAVAADQRLPGMSETPTAAEAGINGFTADTWIGVAAPVGTPKAVLDKLSGLFVRILAMPETKEFYGRQNVVVMRGGQEELHRFQRDQIEVWKRIAASAKVEQQ